MPLPQHARFVKRRDEARPNRGIGEKSSIRPLFSVATDQDGLMSTN